MKLISVFLPALVGAVIGFYLHDIVKEKFIPSPINKAQVVQNFDSSNNLRVNLNSVYRENIILVTSALRRIYNKEPYAPDTLEALNENTDDIGDIIKAYYGTSSKTDFLQIWRSQNNDYVNYTKAVRDKDSTQKIQAENNLNDYVDTSLAYWKKLNPTFEETTYRGMLTERINFIKNFVNYLDTSNIFASYREQHNAYQQNGKIADFLAKNIIKQFPDKFK